MNTQNWKWNEDDMAYFANCQVAQTKSEKVLAVKPWRMTHEQTGIILTLCDELGEFDKGLEFIKGVKSREEADSYISDLKERIDQC